MAKVSTYLNFERQTEAAFNFYKTVFGTEFSEGGIMRFNDTPSSDENLPLPDEDKNLVMHVELPILGGHTLMGTDAPQSMGFKVNYGNNVYIMLQPDTKAETHKLFKSLSVGGEIEQDLQEMFWGDLYGSLTDKFGVRWMFNCDEKK
jgi:PhnB protein